MPVNPRFLAARAAERRNRLLTHVRPVMPLVIPLLDGKAFSVPQVMLTERMRADLQLAENAFMSGHPPLLGDVFNLLWRLHPDFRRPIPTRIPAVRDLGSTRFRFARLWYAYGSYRTARIHRWLSRQVAACDLFAAAAIIGERLAIAEQDSPGVEFTSGRAAVAVAPEFSYFDEVAAFFAETYHMHPDQVLDLPRAFVLQLYRNRVLNQPDGELKVFAPSDALLSS